MNYTSKGARALQSLTAKHGRPVDWATIAPNPAPVTLARLRRLTAINAHGEAYALGAAALGLGELREKLEAVNRENARVGYLTPDLSAKRSALYGEMMTEARRLLSADEFAAFYACF